MSSELTPDNERYIETAVARGEYKDRAEAVNEAIRLMRERERRLAELRADVEVGMNSGEAVPAEQVLDRLEKKAEEIGRRASAR